ncbi:MAG TPA: ATP synthase subunit I [Verrucomicrobiae bacterium]|nr:ATP synthase subunit I [Verrucomicrobiae bacterium]
MDTSAEQVPAVSPEARRAAWGATVGKALVLQWLVVMGFAAIGGLGFGGKAAQSLLLGGGAVAMANTALAAWLTLRLLRTGTIGAAAMLGGEMAKIGLTIALLVIGVKALRAEVAWVALIAGMVAALKAQWLAVWFTRNS